MLVPATDDLIATIVESTFSMFRNGDCDHSYLETRAILAPTLDVVTSINDYMSNLHIAESKTYFSCDTLCKSNSNNGISADVYTPEFLNGFLRASGHSMGLCNGTRLVITKLSDNVVQAKIMTGSNAGARVPRIAMTLSAPRLCYDTVSSKQGHS
ncbi:PREDICTED: uncharacterized protein LOC109190313 [Ipomoea nil]|uniref:uncharacterized protein LOC109190313 n=1 Tax=Ipomoea nil TaxID=35883 RepID=UPI0009015A76|nr:PREDICTED: uncharacterized protein LOC109190313 [Ipomoea nil]